MPTLVRTSVKRSLRIAVCGRSSVKWAPGVRVAMTPNGPLYSAGAFGFGSNVSKWLGAPQRKTKITDLAFAVSAAPAALCTSGIPNATGSEAPIFRNDLRVTPLQVLARNSPMSSIRLLRVRFDCLSAYKELYCSEISRLI